jgi:hypothetical protein
MYPESWRFFKMLRDLERKIYIILRQENKKKDKENEQKI